MIIPLTITMTAEMLNVMTVEKAGVLREKNCAVPKATNAAIEPIWNQKSCFSWRQLAIRPYT